MTSLVLLALLGADTPLSAVLIEGEGWKPVEGNVALDDGVRRLYAARKDGKGRWGVWSVAAKKFVALAKEGETFGDCVVSPGGGKLVVSVPSRHYLYAFQIARDGTLFAQEKTYALRKEKLGKGGSGASSMCFDAKGRLWVAVPEGVACFDEEMRFSGMLSRPERAAVTKAALFDDGLLIECGGKAWKRKVKAQPARTGR